KETIQVLDEPMNVCHLAKLPYELLERIFDLAYADSKPAGLLSRELLPFYRRAGFRNIVADSVGPLLRLMDIVAVQSDLGSYVESLTLPFELVAEAISVSSLAELGSLVVGDQSTPACIPPLLSSLPSPHLLRNLDLNQITSEAPWTLPPALFQLVNLTHLAIGREHQYSLAFFDSLRSLPLQTLCLKASASLASDDLLPLVSAPTQHRTLSVLMLNNVVGKRGGSIANEGPDVSPAGAYVVRLDWERPNWPAMFSCASFSALLAAAARSNVQVVGLTVQALGVEHDLQREEALLAEWIEVEAGRKRTQGLEDVE
ncbi:hypothetical protein JCM8097_001092, partial [Rhodosporidiobolus ruineniae]